MNRWGDRWGGEGGPVSALSERLTEVWYRGFSDVTHDDSWPWYLVTDEARWKKKKEQPEYGDSLWQWLTSNRSETQEK